jgi:hypothetical protein
LVSQDPLVGQMASDLGAHPVARTTSGKRRCVPRQIDKPA